MAVFIFCCMDKDWLVQTVSHSNSLAGKKADNSRWLCLFSVAWTKTGSCRLFPTVIHWQEKRPTIPDGFFSSFILFPAQSTLHTHFHKMYPIMPHQPPGTMSFLTALDNGTQQTRTHAKQKTKQKFINRRTASGQRDTTMFDPEMWVSGNTHSDKTWSILSCGFLATHTVIKPGLS